MQPPPEGHHPEISLLPEVVHSIADGIVITDASGRVTWVNEGFETLCGYGLNELSGRKPGPLLQGPGSDPTAVEVMRDAIASRTRCTVRILNYHRDGTPYHVSIHIAPLFSPEGDLLRFAAVERKLGFMEPLAGGVGAADDLRDFLKTGFPVELLVPMCAWCKRVRDREGIWHLIENFLFIFHREICSHSICPECERAGRGEI